MTDHTCLHSDELMEVSQEFEQRYMNIMVNERKLFNIIWCQNNRTTEKSEN